MTTIKQADKGRNYWPLDKMPWNMKTVSCQKRTSCCHLAVTKLSQTIFFRSTSRLDYYDKKYEFQILTCAHSDIQFMWCDGSEAKERLVLTCNDHAYTSSIHVDH